MPYWAVGIVVVVLVVVYYLLSQQGRERRREKVGVDFAKIPNFYANQTYTDVRGEAAMGIDDRGRRIAIARKHAQPRTRVYSFAHLISAEVLQNDQVIASVTAGSKDAREPARGEKDPSTAPLTGGIPVESLYGSTKQSVRDTFVGLPALKPVLGQLTTAGLRVKFRNGEEVDEVLIRFYDGKAVNVDGVEGQRAMAEAQVLLGSLDIAIKRAGVPPKGAAGPSAPIPKTPVV
jgi:hypothetical protein